MYSIHQDPLPQVAILRGVTPDEIVELASALYEQGFRIIEVPLNSPEPIESIRRLCAALGDKCLCGAGTVTHVEQVEEVYAVGGRLIVSPNVNTEVIKKSLELNMVSMPGFATASEAYEAYYAGARYLKLFPAASYGLGHVKALRSILPNDAKLLAVGGATPDNAGDWFSAGADGLGIGSDLYKPGIALDKLIAKAKRFQQLKK